LWINASSATIYVHAETTLMTEKTGVIGDDFSMGVCKKWEAAFFEKPLASTRKVAFRTSIVLGNDGGALPKMKQIARLGLGGHQGRGNQKVSWIHLEDFCKVVDFVIENESIEGAINVTAPSPTNNKNLMQQIRKRVKMPFGLPQSRALLEIGAWLIKTETELLLKSRNVYPERLLEAGFRFNYPKIETAILSL